MDTIGTTIISLKRISLYRKKCEHNREKTRCKNCGGGSICEHDIIKITCMNCSYLPTLPCSYPLCNYETKRKCHYNNHIKTQQKNINKIEKKKKLKFHIYLITIILNIIVNIQLHIPVLMILKIKIHVLIL